MSDENHIHENSPLLAWARLFLKLMRRGCDTLPATMISIERPSFEIVEQRHPVIEELNSLLRADAKPVVRESSTIIFPYSQWRAKGWHLADLSRWYLNEFMPRLKGVSPKHGKTYFNRLVNYTGLKHTVAGQSAVTVNQLEEVLRLCQDAASRGTHFRESGLQMAIFDPAKDLTASARSNFPCLHQIGLSFDEDGGLQLSAFYPTQFVVERALGNYLGLCQLGLFIASELNIPFSEFTCFVATPQRGSFSKTQLRGLERSASSLFEEIESASQTTPYERQAHHL
jgi:hypothetical protein